MNNIIIKQGTTFINLSYSGDTYLIQNVSNYSFSLKDGSITKLIQKGEYFSLKRNTLYTAISSTYIGVLPIIYEDKDGNSGGNLSWKSKFSGNLLTPIVITNTLHDITSIFANLPETNDNNNFIFYDFTNERFLANKNTTLGYSFRVVLRLDATISRGSALQSNYRVYLKRPNGEIIVSKLFSKPSGVPITLEHDDMEINTRIYSGGNDPYQNEDTSFGGFKIYMEKISGQDLTITALETKTQSLIIEN